MNSKITERIIQDFSLQGLSPEKRQEQIERLFAILQDRVVLESLSRLDDKSKEEVQTLMDTATQDEVFTYLSSHVTGFQEVVERVWKVMQTDYKTLVA